MSLRTTLILAVLLAAGGALVYFLGPEERTEPVSRKPLVPDAVMGDLVDIEATLFSRETFKITRQAGGAYVIHFGGRPGEFRFADMASYERVDALLDAIAQSYREPLTGGASEEDILRLDLDPPRYRLTLRGHAESVALEFGSDEPTGGQVYAREAGSKELFRTGRQIPNQLDFNLPEFRHDGIFDFDLETVSRVDVTLFPEEDEPPRSLSALREGLRSWRLVQPRELKASTGKIRSMIQAMLLLKVEDFLEQDLTRNEPIMAASGLPNTPRVLLSMEAGQAAQVLEVGRAMSSNQQTARLPFRDENLLITIDREKWDQLARFLDVDELRERRLYPSIENSAVAVECQDPGGEVLWSFARQSLHPRGRWEITSPIQREMHEGMGANSWSQVLAELDRIEVTEFLPAGEEFIPEHRLTIRWKSDQVILDQELSLRRDGDSTLVQARDQPGETLRVAARLDEIARLDPVLFQKRELLPGGNVVLETLSHYRFESGDVEIELDKETGPHAPRVLKGTQEQSNRLQSASSGLYGAAGIKLLRPEDVEDTGLDQPVLTLSLTIAGEEQTLKVGREVFEDRRPAFYCSFEPRFGGLIVVLERARLQDLLDLPKF